MVVGLCGYFLKLFFLDTETCKMIQDFPSNLQNQCPWPSPSAPKSSARRPTSTSASPAEPEASPCPRSSGSTTARPSLPTAASSRSSRQTASRTTMSIPCRVRWCSKEGIGRTGGWVRRIGASSRVPMIMGSGRWRLCWASKWNVSIYCRVLCLFVVFVQSNNGDWTFESLDGFVYLLTLPVQWKDFNLTYCCAIKK